jgi:hypothetical protein
MKIVQLFVSLIYFMLMGIVVVAQNNYPTNYFRNPLSIPIYLAGNFGECRPNHFHSGIDIKTLGKENMPVHAAASGYISRIKLDAAGFGHALYINHPNGFTTLYAHLNDFEPHLQAFVKAQQYVQKKWNIDVTLKPDQFPVSQGKFIAYSGNTGSSSAPHLHFEIRNTLSEHPLNPMLFGLPIADTVAPVPLTLYVYDRTASIYGALNKAYTLQRVNNEYQVKEPISISTPAPGFGLQINDFMQGSTNTLTYYTCKLFVDKQLVQTITLDNIGYDVTRYMHAFIDYPFYKTYKDWIQLLFCLPGNELKHIYANPTQQFNWSTNERHALEIECIDAHGNSAVVKANIVVGAIDTINKSYTLLPNKAYSYQTDEVVITLPENTVYDKLEFNPLINKNAKALSAQVITNLLPAPLHKAMRIAIRPNQELPTHLQNKVVMQAVAFQDTSYKAAILDEDRYVVTTKELASLQLTLDTTAPTIITISNAKHGVFKEELRFKVKDNYTSITSFHCTIDKQWVCFEQRGTEWFYKFDEHCKPGKHHLEAIATDENGNKKTLSFNFISK